MTVRILVADDSITIQKIVAMAFENEDAEVEGIGDGQKAFDRIPDFKPDIVLADLDMPGLNGFQLCRKIKGASDLKNIKVMLLSSDFEGFDEELFKKCRAENHISKPFKSVDIVAMVTRVMEEGNTTEDEPVLQENVAEGSSNDNNDELSLEELLESVEKLSIDSKEVLDAEGLIEDIEDAPLLTKFEEPDLLEEQTFSEDVYAEAQPRKMENLDDLDSAFKEIVAGDSKQQSIASSNIKESEMSALGGIIPEPEELPERMAPETFSESERRPHPAEEIDENQNTITDRSSFESTHYQDSHLKEMEYENSLGRLNKVTGEQVKHTLEKLLDSSMQNEITCLSETIEKTIREVIREITPEIARSVIREEIEKINKI